MNRNQLEYFVSLGETLNFTETAKRHLVSQAAISQQIQRLEAELNVTLIERNRRPVKLTGAGKVFLQEAKSILERMDISISRARAMENTPEGRLGIGYIKGYENGCLPQILNSFRTMYPGIIIECSRMDKDTLSYNLLGNELDIIFTNINPDTMHDEDTEYRLVESSRLVAAIYSKHPFARKSELSRSDLKAERLVISLASDNTDYHPDSEPEILFKLSDIESALMMVGLEEGILILPEYAAGKQIYSENISFVPLEGETETEEIFAVWKKSNSNMTLKCFTQNLIKNTTL